MAANSLDSTTKFGAPGKNAVPRSLDERRCEEPGCTTILSSYNSSPTCWLHTGPTRRTPLATG
jgi:hypothetical protein